MARAQTLGPQLNAFVRINAAQAVAAAKRFDASPRKKTMPLGGVPLAHKDMFARAGLASGCGSRLTQDSVAPATSEVLKRLDAAGAIDFGALHMAEFAYGNTGHNAHLGACRNPWSLHHITGGSSSGSGASVAARLNFAALGSDTGGSIRHPATFCGLVGLKTTWGAISTAGVMPLSDTLDTVGTLTRTVEDAALLFGLLTPSHDQTFQARQSLKGVRVGVADNYGHGECTGEAARIMQTSLRALTARGAELVDVAMPHNEALFDAGLVVLQAEATHHHRYWLHTQPDRYTPQVRSRLEAGLNVTAADYLAAKRFITTAQQAVSDELFSRCDVLHAPVVTIPTPAIAESDGGGSQAALKAVARMGRWTRPINYLGLPALALPAGLWATPGTDQGLPMGCQLMAPWHQEALLLAVGSAYQAELGFDAWQPSFD
jgi:aspartyl-tRNA(Asn)/glutamyl-tRNA(Gln) amidotransferase subunit A